LLIIRWLFICSIIGFQARLLEFFQASNVVASINIGEIVVFFNQCQLPIEQLVSVAAKVNDMGSLDCIIRIVSTMVFLMTKMAIAGTRVWSRTGLFGPVALKQTVESERRPHADAKGYLLYQFSGIDGLPPKSLWSGWG
jgi:hypothetical protein